LLEITAAYRNISTEKMYLFQNKAIVIILKSVISLQSFNHEFTRFEKKHYPWSDPIIRKNHKYWSNRQMVDWSNHQNQLTIQLFN